VLGNQRFKNDALTFVSWLGTIYYLTPDAIKTVFTSLAKVCAPGSRIVFDYFESKCTMSDEDLHLFEDIDQGGTRRGHPLQTLMTSDEVTDLLQSTGFRIVEDLSASEIRNRYLSNRSDGLDVPGFVRLCCAEVISPITGE
jgi:O-methyltransferase involved in polyketide biosynthesis